MLMHSLLHVDARKCARSGAMCHKTQLDSTDVLSFSKSVFSKEVEVKEPGERDSIYSCGDCWRLYNQGGYPELGISFSKW